MTTTDTAPRWSLAPLRATLAARRRAPAVATLLVVALVTVLTPRTGAGQDLSCTSENDVEVRTLSFSGNRAFSDALLSDAVVTTASDRTWRFFHLFGTKRCLDRVEFPRDVVRLVLFYRNHGYFEARVDTVVRHRRPRTVDVTFRIAEEEPIIISTFAVTGLDSVAGRRRVERDLPVRAGDTFDRYKIEAARDTIRRRLRNSGYPRADILLNDSLDYARRTATVVLSALPGPLAHIGQVDIAIAPVEGRSQQISERAVRGMLGLHTGDLYREQDLVDAQRALYQTEAYRHVDVRLQIDTARAAPDSSVNLEVGLAENYTRSARVGAGWGTLDCFRTQGTVTDRNFLHGARRLELTGRLSKIGIGEPLSSESIRKSLCSQANGDPYSSRINYYAGATFRQPYIFGLRNVPTLTLYRARESEYKVYLRTTNIGGLATLARQGRPRLPMTWQYQLELGRTESQPALFCAVFNICRSEERENVLKARRLAVGSWSITHDRSDNALSPTRGTIARLELRHASRWIWSDSTLQFNKALGDMAWYFPGGGRSVIAARIRAGGVFSAGASLAGAQQFVPPQERLYAGGPNTVRGFRQNELGPLVYIARTIDSVQVDDTTRFYFVPTSGVSPQRVVPVGGNALAVANFEYRFWSPILPELLQWTLFMDVGDVWNRNGTQTVNFNQFKWTPGFGLRVFTPVGPIRVDVGYNPYARPPGAVYYDAPPITDQNRVIAPLYCVTPGNTIPAHLRGTTSNGTEIWVQDDASCPTGFTPNQPRGTLGRLTFNFSIGQAF